MDLLIQISWLILFVKLVIDFFILVDFIIPTYIYGF